MRSIYLLLIGAGLFLASCSASYRSARTTDDVYYTPSSADDGEYVSVYNSDEQDVYNYREDYEIRRGIRNPIYRNSVAFNIGFGFGSPFYSGYYGLYDPFYSPFYSPYYSPFSYHYSMYGFYSPYYMGGFYRPFYGFGNPYYGYGGYYGHGYYPTYSTIRYYDNGPRRSGLIGSGMATPRVISPRTSGTAPVRNIGTTPRESNAPIRRVTVPDDRRVTPGRTENRRMAPVRSGERRVAPSRNERNYRPAPSRSERNYRPAPSRSEQRRYTPAPSRSESPRRSSPSSNENNYRPAPTRTFEPSPAPAAPRSIEPSAPSRSSSGSTAPVRRL